MIKIHNQKVWIICTCVVARNSIKVCLSFQNNDYIVVQSLSITKTSMQMLFNIELSFTLTIF